MIASAFTLNNYSDILRLLVAVLGAFLIGADIAFSVKARSLFPDRTVSFWRVFFAGKTLLAGVLVGRLYLASGELQWQTYVTALGFSLSAYALVAIWWNRPYRYVVIRPELLGHDERTQIIEDLEDIEAHEQGGGAGTERTS
jgi:hypothetical protein